MTEEIKPESIKCEICGKKKQCIHCYFSKRNSKAGKKGGKVTSERKKLAGINNLIKAREAKKRSENGNTK